MVMIMLALRVLGGWFAFGIALGLCWTAACFTVRYVPVALAAAARVAFSRRMISTLLLPAADLENAAQEELFGLGLGLAMPSTAAHAHAALNGSLIRSQA